MVESSTYYAKRNRLLHRSDEFVDEAMVDCSRQTCWCYYRCCPCPSPKPGPNRRLEGAENQSRSSRFEEKSRQENSCRQCRTVLTISIQDQANPGMCDLRNKTFESSHCTRQSANLAAQTRSCLVAALPLVEQLERQEVILKR